MPTFELRYRKEARIRVKGKMVRDEQWYATLPDKPAQFRPLSGSYDKVSAEAILLNQVRVRSGFKDYLFFPEVDTAPLGADDEFDEAA